MVQSLPANAEMQETRDDALEKKWQCPPVFLPRKSCEHRSLVGYIQFMASQERHD